MKKLFTSLTVLAVVSLSAQNLLTNPSFESDFDGWMSGPQDSYTAPEVVTGGSQDGDKHVAYTPTATTGFYQNITVTGGENYEISFWYKATGDDTDARIWSIFRGENGALYTTEDASTDAFRNYNEYLSPATEWTFHKAEMPAHADAVSLDVAFRAYSGSSVSFDNIKAGVVGTMNVKDVNDFTEKVKMNTVLTDKLVVQLNERATVNIYTIDGRLVSSNRVNNGESIDVSALTKGVYVVTVSNGYTTTTQKVVKK